MKFQLFGAERSTSAVLARDVRAEKPSFVPSSWGPLMTILPYKRSRCAYIMLPLQLLAGDRNIVPGAGVACRLRPSGISVVPPFADHSHYWRANNTIVFRAVGICKAPTYMDAAVQADGH